MNYYYLRARSSGFAARAERRLLVRRGQGRHGSCLLALGERTPGRERHLSRETGLLVRSRRHRAAQRLRHAHRSEAVPEDVRLVPVEHVLHLLGLHAADLQVVLGLPLQEELLAVQGSRHGGAALEVHLPADAPPVVRVPDLGAAVPRHGGDGHAVRREGRRDHGFVVAVEQLQALARAQAPEPRGPVLGAGHDRPAVRRESREEHGPRVALQGVGRGDGRSLPVQHPDLRGAVLRGRDEPLEVARGVHAVDLPFVPPHHELAVAGGRVPEPRGRVLRGRQHGGADHTPDFAAVPEAEVDDHLALGQLRGVGEGPLHEARRKKHVGGPGGGLGELGDGRPTGYLDGGDLVPGRRAQHPDRDQRRQGLLPRTERLLLETVRLLGRLHPLLVGLPLLGLRLHLGLQLGALLRLPRLPGLLLGGRRLGLLHALLLDLLVSLHLLALLPRDLLLNHGEEAGHLVAGAVRELHLAREGVLHIPLGRGLHDLRLVHGGLADDRVATAELEDEVVALHVLVHVHHLLELHLAADRLGGVGLGAEAGPLADRRDGAEDRVVSDADGQVRDALEVDRQRAPLRDDDLHAHL
mmetsp:Transcript_39326/g.116535  ORF Transcript_39326/g.116535 Transcript_39326/m.116535 type:complete len:582 (+) Transcript_39326:1-1746(+)